MYSLKYEKRYGSSYINPWSQEELLKQNVRIFSSSEQSLWIKSGEYAYCFVKDFDNVENHLINDSAYEANEFLKNNYDRIENINEVTKKWI